MSGQAAALPTISLLRKTHSNLRVNVEAMEIPPVEATDVIDDAANLWTEEEAIEAARQWAQRRAIEDVVAEAKALMLEDSGWLDLLRREEQSG